MPAIRTSLRARVSRDLFRGIPSSSHCKIEGCDARVVTRIFGDEQDTRKGHSFEICEESHFQRVTPDPPVSPTILHEVLLTLEHPPPLSVFPRRFATEMNDIFDMVDATLPSAPVSQDWSSAVTQALPLCDVNMTAFLHCYRLWLKASPSTRRRFIEAGTTEAGLWTRFVDFANPPVIDLTLDEEVMHKVPAGLLIDLTGPNEVLDWTGVKGLD